MIIDIRGTHGSGKSHIMRNLVTEYKNVPLQGETYAGNKHHKRLDHLGYYFPKWDAVLIGKYESVCGGCDGVKTADEVCRRVRLFASKYRHVLLEGILVSHTFGRYSDLATEVEANWQPTYNFCFLDTPLNTCISRVRKRRITKQREDYNKKITKLADGKLIEPFDPKPLDPKNVKKDHARIWGRLRLQAIEADHTVTVIPYRNSLSPILKLLGKKQ